MILVILKETGKKNLLKNKISTFRISGGFFCKKEPGCLIKSAFLLFLQHEQFYRFQFGKKTSSDAGKQQQDHTII